MDGIPAPLSIGKVKLSDCNCVSGIVFEAVGARGATEIAGLGSWRA